MSAPDTLIHGLTQDAADILLHTSTNGRYVVGPESANEFALIQRMVEAGLLEDCGPQRIAGGAHLFYTTPGGRRVLADYQAALPKPKPLTNAQRRYRDFLDADSGLTFIEWLRCRRNAMAGKSMSN